MADIYLEKNNPAIWVGVHFSQENGLHVDHGSHTSLVNIDLRLSISSSTRARASFDRLDCLWIVWVNLVVKTHETVKLWEFSASRRFNNRESCIFHSLIRTSRLFFVCSSFFQFVAQTVELTMTGSTGSKPSRMSGSAI